MAVVVHPTWRYTHDVEELKLLLGALGAKVVGATPRGPRYESTQWWLQTNPFVTSMQNMEAQLKNLNTFECIALPCSSTKRTEALQIGWSSSLPAPTPRSTVRSSRERKRVDFATMISMQQ